MNETDEFTIISFEYPQESSASQPILEDPGRRPAMMDDQHPVDLYPSHRQGQILCVRSVRPHRKGLFGTCRVVLDPVDGLAGDPNGLSDT